LSDRIDGRRIILGLSPADVGSSASRNGSLMWSGESPSSVLEIPALKMRQSNYSVADLCGSILALLS
jgi:hypothetical protein